MANANSLSSSNTCHICIWLTLLLGLNSFFCDYLSWYKSLHSFIKYQSIKEHHQRSKMKLILILATLLAMFEASNACINPCNGVTPATCTAPCFTCGWCSTSCCQSWGRSESENPKTADRLFFNLPCTTRQENEEEEMDMDPGTSKTCLDTQ